MAKPRILQLRRRAAAEAALMLAAGVFLGLLGPFGTIARGPVVDLVYWPSVIVGGGVIGLAIDIPIRRRLTGFWAPLLADVVLMTVPVSLLVSAVSYFLLGPRSDQPHFASLLLEVFVISFAVMALRQLAWRDLWTERRAHDPDDSAAEERGDPAEAFRRRLSARRRAARLIAVEAEDHYLRVHTDAGDELITLRFADALHELEGDAGGQTHRSWWVAADAIEGARWRRGRGELRLACGLTAPVSRNHSARLRREGWL
ncbi:MAG: LytTR family DNA-binding domain-containing protein [Caulobacteraceae bacterium]